MDSGSRALEYNPSSNQDSVNVCSVIKNVFKTDTGRIAIVAAYFAKGSDSIGNQGTFLIHSDTTSFIPIFENRE